MLSYLENEGVYINIASTTNFGDLHCEGCEPNYLTFNWIFDPILQAQLVNELI